MPKSGKRPAKRRRPSPRSTVRDSDRSYSPAGDISGPIGQALTDAEARGRLLLTRDPSLRSLTHRQTALLDASAPEAGAMFPVALVEPVSDRIMVLDSGPYPLTLAIAAKLGLTRFQAHVTPPAAAANWAFRDGTHCELVDPTGTVIARFPHPPNQQWRSAACAHEHVLVLYGGKLGVRRPVGTPADEYDDAARDAELHASLAAGAVVAGAIAYLGQ